MAGNELVFLQIDHLMHSTFKYRVFNLYTLLWISRKSLILVVRHLISVSLLHIVISLLRRRKQLQQGTPQSTPTLEWLEQWWQGKSRDYSLRNGQICCRRSCCSRAEHAKEEMSWPHSISNADESPGTQVSFSGPRRHSLQNGFVFHMPLATARLPRSDWSRECIWP